MPDGHILYSRKRWEFAMKLDGTIKILLAIAVLFLGMIALRPLVQPAPVFAQAGEGHKFYVEPGTTMLRKPDGTSQVYGKVFIDMNTGDVWGFPTNTTDPYPSNPTSSTPPKSHPMYLGRFVLSDAVLK
jgi:hypothetical protein